MKIRKNESAPIYNRKMYNLRPPNTDKKRWKEFLKQYTNASLLKENGFPVEIDIELNTTCNLKCIHCIHSIKDRGKYYMDWQTYKKIITEAVSIGTKSIKLNYWNEPLLNKNIDLYIKYALETGIVNVFFATNGILLTEEISVKLINAGLTKILFSIDALSREVYKKERGTDAYNTVVKNIKMLIRIRNQMHKRFPIVRVNFLKTKENKHEEKGFFKYWHNIADMIIFQEMNELPDIDSGIFIQHINKDYKCSFPFKLLAIDAMGNIYPCPCMGGNYFKLGNIKEITLLQAWESDKAKSLRINQKVYGHKFHPVCRRCIDGS